jgi:hypothetical protein
MPTLVSDTVAAHKFASLALQLSTRFSEAVQKPRTALSIKFETTRDLTEGEYYVIGCGYSVSHLLSLVQQLEQIPAYLKGYVASKETRIAGVTRVSHIIYHWENYLIRARSLEDRVLHVIVDVLHLGINAKDVNYLLIRRNTHVESGTLGALLDRCHKLVSPVAPERNRIIHERGLLDQDLREMEFWNLLRRLVPERKHLAAGNYLTTVRRVVPKRITEIEEFTGEVGRYLIALFDDLAPRFIVTADRLLGGNSVASAATKV